MHERAHNAKRIHRPFIDDVHVVGGWVCVGKRMAGGRSSAPSDEWPGWHRKKKQQTKQTHKATRGQTQPSVCKWAVFSKWHGAGVLLFPSLLFWQRLRACITFSHNLSLIPGTAQQWGLMGLFISLHHTVESAPFFSRMKGPDVNCCVCSLHGLQVSISLPLFTAVFDVCLFGYWLVGCNTVPADPWKSLRHCKVYVYIKRPFTV